MLKNFLKFIDQKFLNDYIAKKKNFYEKKIEIKRLKKQIFNTQIYYSKKKKFPIIIVR